MAVSEVTVLLNKLLGFVGLAPYGPSYWPVMLASTAASIFHRLNDDAQDAKDLSPGRKATVLLLYGTA